MKKNEKRKVKEKNTPLKNKSDCSQMSLFRNKYPKEDFENMVISEPTDFRQINHATIESNGQVNINSIPSEWKLNLRKAGIHKKDLKDEKTRTEIFSLLSKNDKRAPSSTHGTLPPPPPGRKPPTSSSGKQVPSHKPPAPPNKKLPTPPQGKGKPIPPPRPGNRDALSHHHSDVPLPPSPHGEAPPPVPPPRGGAPALPPPRRGTKNVPPPPPLDPNAVTPTSTTLSGPSLAEQLQAKKNDLNSVPVEDNTLAQQEDDIVGALRGIMIKRREDMNMVDNEEEEEDEEDDWSD
ncbi:Wiskott-Aldrich syndrome protein, putative [Entamoeba dispar SAW760]|uniref:Wiskott-Aldrich syndrome protein, putative n=1 Tax=Entamoeba dispar (strain ATCC PRA-260 / SAW760) TaxID=370354 RepID=B0E7G0_ENTDS|nr:Wiskott-Aldrich syndrome protein, putative [Entamoeba dispar SAW760]EDR29531.1 Wiskott-Aldrich syndrome protein, putative [Entamoeba dispar SAW760]|eukprot:EDR29531.1 Wiskott-Aldrich syndrome protein, putative [Entamoeba dispar SAW760]